MTKESRTPPSKMAKQLVKYLRPQRPDYNYLRDLFRHLRKELDVGPVLRKLRFDATYQMIWNNLT